MDILLLCQTLASGTNPVCKLEQVFGDKLVVGVTKKLCVCAWLPLHPGAPLWTIRKTVYQLVITFPTAGGTFHKVSDNKAHPFRGKIGLVNLTVNGNWSFIE